MSPVKHLWQICTDIIDTILHHQVNECVLKDSFLPHFYWFCRKQNISEVWLLPNVHEGKALKKIL